MLSIGGRLTLIKFVLSSLPLYHMPIYKAPVGVLNSMESYCRNFLNGVERSERKLFWISWKRVLASKKYGGLGVSSFFALNRALLFKWIWRFISSESSLWSHVIKAIYGDRGSLDTPSSFHRRSTWLDIIREVRSLSSKALENLYSWLYALELDKSIKLVDKLRDSSLVDSFQRQPRGGIEEDQFRLLNANISGILLPNSNDRWIWSLNSSGDFLVKSVRSFIDDSLLPKEDVPTRWVKYVPIKINIFS
ncbi:hypothetical protein Tco_0120082 [Tanacetum coccineum]